MSSKGRKILDGLKISHKKMLKSKNDSNSKVVVLKDGKVTYQQADNDTRYNLRFLLKMVKSVLRFAAGFAFIKNEIIIAGVFLILAEIFDMIAEF